MGGRSAWGGGKLGGKYEGREQGRERDGLTKENIKRKEKYKEGRNKIGK